MDHTSFPRILRARQPFPSQADFPVEATLATEFHKIRSRIKPGARIAVAVGSRGITNLVRIVKSTVDQLRAAGANPFIIPAMGSHGGATDQGQADVLTFYGITDASVGAPVRPSMEVRQVGTTDDGVPVFCSVEALQSDGIVIVNRVKPHTDFAGTMGSGIMKMSVIGLGKRTGAAACHGAATRLGHEHVFRTVARVMFEKAPVLAGVAVLENQRHQTGALQILPVEQIESLENELFRQATAWMPKLPFESLDLLVIDQIGKNISGAGMDPNVIGRGVQGYSSALNDRSGSPSIRRIFVRDLTEETNGNGIGIGLADFTTTRLVHKLDKRAVFINSLTSLTPHAAKIPIHFDTDLEVMEAALQSLALDDLRDARVVRIQDTLTLEEITISESLMEEAAAAGLQLMEQPQMMEFNAAGSL